MVWRAKPGKGNIRGVNNFSGCANTGTDAFFIDDNEYVSGFGWDFDKYPLLATRKGRTAFGAAGGGITRLLTNFGNAHLVRAVGTSLQYYNGSAWTPITGTFTDTDWAATNFDVDGPALILTNGTDSVKKWNGTTLSNLSADAPKGKYIASDNRRVYIAVKDEVHFCAFQDALDWTSELNSGIVEYWTANGGDITSLHSFEGQIWAFKKDGYCLIFHTGDANATHRLVEQSNDIGCDSDKTVQEVGPYLLWKGPNDVYLGAGGAASPIGQPIRKYLDSVNKAYADKNFAWTDGKRYYLCLVTSSNTEPDVELVYDTQVKKWHVRSLTLGGLRYGAILNNVPYAGDVNGQTFQLNSGTTDNGTPIAYQVTSKPYDEKYKEALKEYYEMHLQAYLQGYLTVKVSTTDRAEDFITLDTMDANSVAQSSNIIVPMDSVPLTNWLRHRLEGTGYVELQQVQRHARLQNVMH